MDPYCPGHRGPLVLEIAAAWLRLNLYRSAHVVTDLGYVYLRPRRFQPRFVQVGTESWTRRLESRTGTPSSPDASSSKMAGPAKGFSPSSPTARPSSTNGVGEMPE